MRDARILLHFKFFWKPAPPKPEPVVPDTPGHAIKYYRMQKGIGLRTLVSKMNGAPNKHVLQDYERGRSEPTYQAILKIAEALELDPALFFDDYLVFIDFPYPEKIKQMRQTLHLTQTDLAKEIGAHNETVMNWELKRTVPSLESYEKLKKYFETRGMKIIDDDDYPEQGKKKQFNRVINRSSRKKTESMLMIQKIRDDKIAPPEEKHTIGELIWYYRVQRGLSREELCRLSNGFSISSLLNIEKNRQQPRYRNVLLFAKALKIEPVLLYDDYCAFIASPYSQKLKEIRSILHLTPLQLAQQMHLGHSTITRWEAEVLIPTRENYEMIRQFCLSHNIKFDIKGIAVSVSEIAARKENIADNNWKHPNKAKLITEVDVDPNPVTPPDHKLTTGQAIMYYRTERGVSRLQLVQLCEGSPNLASIKSFEYETEYPRYSTVVKIAKALKVDPDLLYDDYLRFIDYPYSKRIVEIMDELHLSPAELADAIGFNKAAIYCWKSGGNEPSRGSFIKLSRFCEDNNISILHRGIGEYVNDAGREKIVPDQGTSERNA